MTLIHSDRISVVAWEWGKSDKEEKDWREVDGSTKGYEEVFWGGYFHYLDCSIGFTSAYISKIIKAKTLNVYSILTLIIPE